MTNTIVFRALRDAKGLTHSEIARRVGISTSAVRKIEAGECSPSVHTAIKIARLLQGQVEVLWSVAA